MHDQRHYSTVAPRRPSRAPRQSTLREVNHRIHELAADWNQTGVSVFLCECSDPACADAVEISSADYARISGEKSHFLVFPGHERPEGERVVQRTSRFVVVEGGRNV
jgi:hypothetical protein